MLIFLRKENASKDPSFQVQKEMLRKNFLLKYITTKNTYKHLTKRFSMVLIISNFRKRPKIFINGGQTQVASPTASCPISTSDS